MLASVPEEIDSTLAHYYANADAEENEAIMHVSELCRSGNDAVALSYLQWYQEAFSLSMQGKMVLIELLYHNGRYQEAYDYLIANLKSPTLSASELPIIAVIVSILLRLHIFDEALHFSEMWLDKLHKANIEHNSFHLVNRGLRDILTDVKQLLTISPIPTEEQINRVVL